MRFQWKLAMLVALVAGGMYVGSAMAKDDEKIKDIKGCMAFQKKVREDLPTLIKAKDPNWDEIQKETKEWVGVAEILTKQTPPKGTAESWKRQTEKYLENVKAADAAAQKKDAAAATKALATIGVSCMGCHSQHRPKK